MGILERRISRLETARRSFDDSANELCDMDLPFESTAYSRESLSLDNKIKNLRRVQKAAKVLTLGLVK